MAEVKEPGLQQAGAVHLSIPGVPGGEDRNGIGEGGAADWGPPPRVVEPVSFSRSGYSGSLGP